MMSGDDVYLLLLWWLMCYKFIYIYELKIECYISLCRNIYVNNDIFFKF